MGPDLEVNEWFMTLTDREKDVLVLSRAQGPQAGFRNLSQSVGRVHSNTWLEDCQKHVAPTMLPGQILFLEVLKPPRLLLGRKCLMYLGFPVVPLLREMAAAGFDPCVDPLPDPSLAPDAAGLPVKKKQRRSQPDRAWLTESLMQDLGGNAMALPVLLAIIQAALCALSLQGEATANTDASTSAALQALGLLV